MTTKYKLFASCYDKKGKILAYGENSYTKSHPLMQQLSVKVDGNHKKIYLHAEVQALLRAGDRKVHRLVVERFDKEGKPSLAKPCEVCSKALQLYGVKEVWYTSDNSIVKEKVHG